MAGYAHTPGEAAAGPGAWYPVLFLTLAASISKIDRQVLALAIGPMKRDLGINESQIVLLGGLAFTLLYSVFTMPAAGVADQWRRNSRAGSSRSICWW